MAVLFGCVLFPVAQAQSSDGTNKTDAIAGDLLTMRQSPFSRKLMPPGTTQDHITNLAESHRRRRLTLDDRLKVLAKTLDLSDAQKTAVATILEERQREALHLRLDSSINGNTRMERFRSLQDNTVERIREILNDEQKMKYDPLASRKLRPAPDQRTVEDWLELTSPK